MLERQFCASSYTIDFEENKVLLVYNKKLEKWLQPGGHIEGVETPIEAAIRETYEETGIKIEIVGPTYDGEHYEPIACERYINKVGDMIDIQYLSIPLTKEINSLEGKEVKWITLENLENQDNIDEEIKRKVKKLYNQYKPGC